ncbi:MAG: DUF2993 domain-containing protein [Bacteroidota bacterium]
MRIPPLPALVLLALAASGCSLDGRAASEIEATLPEALGPADSYEATVDGFRLTSSSADRVAVIGRRVAREGSPVIARLDVTLWGVAFDRGAGELTRVDSARAVAAFVPQDLAAYLIDQGVVTDASLTFSEPDRMSIRVEGELRGIRIPVGAEILGRLRASGGRVVLDVESVRAAGLSLGGRIASEVGRRINPIADLTEEDIALDVTRVRVSNGVLVVEATADPADLTR